MVELYNWQRKAISAYKGTGIVEAVTGSGKTLVGKKIVEKISGSKIICAPTLPILEQWKVVLREETNIEYYTFQTLCKKNLSCKMLIVDEAHRSVSPEFIKLYDNVTYKYILGLTATPNKKCIAKCGKPFCKVDFDEAKVAPFKVHFIGIDLDFTITASRESMVFFALITNALKDRVKIYIITNRADDEGSREETEQELSQLDIYYDNLVITGNKADYILKEGIKIYFDDTDEMFINLPSSVTVFKIREDGNFDFTKGVHKWVYGNKTGINIDDRNRGK